MTSSGYRQLARDIGRWILRWRHPLWWLPDVPSEQDEAYRRIWANLRQVDHVVDGRHDTDEWFQRSGDFVYVCAPIPPEALNPEFDRLRDILASYPFVRLVPRPILNITIQELGYLNERPVTRDEITQEWLDEFIRQAETPIQSFQPFQVLLGGANSYADAAFLDVHDGGWFSRIHGRLLDFASQPPKMRYAYLPEPIIAQYIEVAPIQRLVRDLVPFRDVSFGSFRVSTIDVLRVSTAETFAEPQLVHRFELGNEPGLIDRVSPTRPEEPPLT